MRLLSQFYKKRFLIAAVFFIVASSHSLYSQGKNKLSNSRNVFSFSFDNDVYFNTDKYYTNGFFFSLSGERNKLSKIENLLFPFSFGKKYFTVSLYQKIFTPADFSTAEIKAGERPFAANLAAQYSLRNFSQFSKMILTERVSAGVIGKYAYGKEVQNGIHSLLPHSSDVPGWENQIPSGALFNYFLSAEKNLFTMDKIILNYSAWGIVGMPQTAAGINAHLLFSSFSGYFKNPFYFSYSSFDYQIDFTAGTLFKFYDGNLQGNLLGKPAPYRIENITKLIFHADAGIRIKLRMFIWEARAYFITPEFPGGTNHLWGRIIIGYKF